MGNQVSAPAQGKSPADEIYELVKERTQALEWYADAFAVDVRKGKEHNQPLPPVHITLMYQQVESFYSLLGEIEGYMTREVAG